MTLDEAIEQFKYDAECNRADLDLSFAEDNNKVAEWLKELKQYRAIGTVEECRVAVEKQKTKKPTPIDYKKYMDVVKNAKFLKGAFWCPNCNHAIRSGDYCDDCGQKLDWSDKG